MAVKGQRDSKESNEMIMRATKRQSDEATKGKALPTLLLFCLLPAACCLLLLGCKPVEQQARGGEQRRGEPVKVKLAPVSVQSVQRSVEVFGTLWGDEETTISAKVAGRVLTVKADIGDRAAPGEVLAELEKTDYELAGKQQELVVRQVLAKLNLTGLPGKDFDVTAVPSVRRAKLQADNAEAKFQRGKLLHEQKPPLLSDQDYADLETAAAVARSNYDVELVAARSLLAEVQTGQAELELIQQKLKDATVRTPEMRQESTHPASTRPGVEAYAVAERLVSVGEYVKEGTPLFKLVDDNPIKLRAPVPERYAAQLAVGQTATVRVEAYPKQDFTGTVSRINPRVDPASRTFQIEVIIPNDDRRLKPGGFAKAWVQTQVDPGIVFVPKPAVQEFAGVSKVFVVADGKAKDIAIEPGVERDSFIEARGKLKGDEKLIITGLNRIAGGVPVIVE